jgi:hypothetical protein
MSTIVPLRNASTGEPIDFEARALTVAGFTGRHSDAVEAHIEELEKRGVARPPEIPVLRSNWPCPKDQP